MEATDSTPVLSLEDRERLKEERVRRTEKRIRLERESTDRLYWTLAGDFPACISVMKTFHSGRDGLEPFQNPDGTWHGIACLPVKQPPVSSIVASLEFLKDWEHDWVEHHECHQGAEYVTYGELGDEDRPYAREMKEDGSWEEDSDTEFLNKCCGRGRPMYWRDVSLHVAASTDKGFVTIRDYVSAVHPWLMSLREQLVEAKVDSPLSAAGPLNVALETTWIVNTRIVPKVDIEIENDWLGRFQPPRPISDALRQKLRLARGLYD